VDDPEHFQIISLMFKCRKLVLPKCGLTSQVTVTESCFSGALLENWHWLCNRSYQSNCEKFIQSTCLVNLTRRVRSNRPCHWS